MKLLRLKITDPNGFRSLPCGFEHHFRSEWTLQEELANNEGFAPFVCAGPNGSGKSNLLEVLGAIFYQLEIQRVRRSFLPEALQNDEQDLSPSAFELGYLIRVPKEYRRQDSPEWAKVKVWKNDGETVRFMWENQGDFDTNINEVFGSGYADIILPQYVLGYSSGENEILSLPFFKMRFIQFDEYWNALSQQLPYPGYPEARMAYLDNSFSQAILLCNLLFQEEATLQPFREDVGIESLKEFRIILRRTILLTPEQLESFVSNNESQPQTLESIIKDHPALTAEEDELGNTRYRLNLLQLLEGDEKSSRMISALKRCATLSFEDDTSDSLILDYWVNEATKQAFRENFSNDPLSLFQAFQVLLTLNLYTVGDAIKADLYQSNSHYVSETIPTLASDQRIMRFKFVRFSKVGCDEPLMLKELSDGEHQLLHSLGLCLLFRNTNSLFLLDEPETHFNPDWRANFISRLRQCFPKDADTSQEMLITTHTPFLISDSKPEKVLVFSKDKITRKVSITHPKYNTLGASINKITMNTFGKRETIGAYAKGILDDLRKRFEQDGEENEALINEIHQQLGDSVEKLLLIKAILDGEANDSEEGNQ
ncbi:restriction system-associated AAA family ATPase [Shewanella putrefaciens]|uniref:restriction system-associated AAA family ATPase n=1 Tax=Shewanella putrefaciens TaxID=24 RepID=UPI0018E81B25|nr:restriction system-associated AAA family ATPase [Shewanella putrefaciens]